MRRVFFFTTVFVVAAVCCTSALAQGQSASLEEALSRIRSGMASAGVKSVENTPNGQRIDIRAFRPLVLDGCTIQIQMTNDDTASAGGRGGIFNAIYTIPLGKLDFTKIRTSYGDYYSREGNSTFVTSLTSSRDGEKGSASVTLPTIGQQKTISYVAIVRFNYDLGPREKNPGAGLSAM